ncbi:hypothetical protein Ddye_013153 [Dipteronia dyeriana]|uniref:Uncharacterized protein n=1 Tax=Dipteronia dyeriana TaxID=168575 RepID=A0AAD9X5V8_9ROSI|nr:hypothetical protein Ddye_013153 [Dipteronia dyeriana]
MFLSERAGQRWRSVDMIPAILKAKTPTFDFLFFFADDSNFDLLGGVRSSATMIIRIVIVVVRRNKTLEAIVVDDTSFE